MVLSLVQSVDVSGKIVGASRARLQLLCQVALSLQAGWLTPVVVVSKQQRVLTQRLQHLPTSGRGSIQLSYLLLQFDFHAMLISVWDGFNAAKVCNISVRG